ncbi:MAG: Rne/Rng family ribonuclease [bacterium]|nr:Rne/Rng family ribonuclease [bacterium]
MKRNILANCEEGEIKVAIIEDEEVTELFIERDTEGNNVGNIYLAKVENILPNLEAIFLDAGIEKSVYLPFSEVVTPVSELKKGDKLMIQVTKSEISTKGAKVTTNVSLPGRYLVFQPFESGIGVSRNIQDQKERRRLREIIRESLGKKGGMIVRTEGAGAEKAYFEQEIKYLNSIWQSIRDKFDSNQNVLLLHEDFNILIKMVREKLTDDVDFFAINSSEEYSEVYNFVNNITPEHAKKIVLYENGRNPFADYGIESITEKIMRQKIYLKSGGYLIIQEAESLCAIDVNSGSTKGENLEAVILKTNLEAVKEIALQLRLRNIGGIIVIDFIDMDKAEHKDEVIKVLKKACKLDKARIKISPITAMGLVEMTRQRKSESIMSYLSEDCPCCYGTGRIYSKESVILKIREDLKEFTDLTKNHEVTIYLHPRFEKFLNKRRVNFLKKDILDKLVFSYDHAVSPQKYEIIVE